MSVRILIGDAREQLRTLPDASVHCVVTSPPYWGLRDYGTAKWEGGDPECDHVGVDARTVSGGAGKQYTNEGSNRVFSGDCKCGARRIDSQIGLEPTPEEYTANMVEVFREVRRVLRDDGTCWVNLGDSYAANRGYQVPDGKWTDVGNSKSSAVPLGLKPKDLVGIPWRIAFALQADGWWLRQDIIWSKPNPMPESVRDRCTKAHEYIFMLSKSARYYYDADAIREPYNESSIGRYESPMQSTDRNGGQIGGARQPGGEWNPKNEIIEPNPLGRNKRSVWTITTQPFPEAHFATFPPALVEPCIKAGCPKGGTVLDPFGGSGTTGLVADRLGRSAVLIELNPEYAAMAERRIKGDAGLFAEVDAA